MPKLWTYSVRSVWQRRATSLASVLGIALVVFVLCASRMLARGMRQTMASSGKADKALVMEHDSWAEQGSRIDHAVLGRVAAAPGVARDAKGQALVMGETVSHLLLRSTRDRTRIGTIQVRGIDDNVLALRPEVRLVAGRMPKPGTDEAAAGKGVVGLYQGLALGAECPLGRKRSAKIVGVFETGGTAHESELWADLELTRAAFGIEASLSSVTAQLESAAALDRFAEALTQDKQVGLSVARESAYYEKVSGGVADVVSVLGLVETLIFSFGALLGAMITMYAAIAQREPEIGVLRALGFARRQILAAFLLESVALSLGGALGGVGLALLTPLLDFSTTNFATAQDVAFRFTPSFEILLVAVAMGALLGVLAGALPAIRAARMSPTRAMRT
jgi:putative ABC transport system permease protein